MAYSASKRLQSEIQQMSKNEVKGISARPREEEDLYSWIGRVEGSEGTVYEGMTFDLSLEFPQDYPFNPPQVRFMTPCFHPNVDESGYICLDVLTGKKSSLSIQSILAEPYLGRTRNGYAAWLWNNQAEFKKQLLKQYGRPE
eukprot:Gb_09129 [translate_table: standard]